MWPLDFQIKKRIVSAETIWGNWVILGLCLKSGLSSWFGKEKIVKTNYLCATVPPPPSLPQTPKTSAVPVRDTVAITKNEDFLSEENDHAHDKGKTFKMGAKVPSIQVWPVSHFFFHSLLGGWNSKATANPP